MIEVNRIPVGKFEFDCRIAGNAQNECVILLHGFPETSFMWSTLMDSLAHQGFYCIAPNLRGYSERACPKGSKNYTLDILSSDVLGIADALNIDKFHLVGHDWGAGIGWHTVFNNEDRVISWSALSIPHSRAFGKALKTDKAQKKKSRYIGWFLLPLLPELYIRRNDFSVFKRLWKQSSAEEIDDYLSVFRRKQTLTAALNYYRANIGKGKLIPVGDIQTPTLFIWGKNDVAVGSTAARLNSNYVKGEYTHRELDAGHWLIQTNYQEVESAISDHLNKYRNSTSN